jgi:hypothetical protein
MGWQDRRRLPLRARDPRGGLIEAPHGQFMPHGSRTDQAPWPVFGNDP